ncbi:unnamed protein product [Caenorhabditis auriculariae]|uniref:Uncharacterized protein n=1 Tax=Caenorhabditis auriculariae TaxID=2777116 RepID=A0A8S1GVU7_9PELO|nr:unnamed protein product [Caenorhabditis auriculariae]
MRPSISTNLLAVAILLGVVVNSGSTQQAGYGMQGAGNWLPSGYANQNGQNQGGGDEIQGSVGNVEKPAQPNSGYNNWNSGGGGQFPQPPMEMNGQPWNGNWNGGAELPQGNKEDGISGSVGVSSTTTRQPQKPYGYGNGNPNGFYGYNSHKNRPMPNYRGPSGNY